MPILTGPLRFALGATAVAGFAGGGAVLGADLGPMDGTVDGPASLSDPDSESDA